MWGFFSHRVTAEFMNDDSVGEGFIVRFNMKSSFSVVQSVLLNEVDIIHTCNLHTNTGFIILLQIKAENLIKLIHILYHKTSTPFYPFEESWCIHVKFTPPLNPMKRSILTGLLTDRITVHKHGDQMTGGKPPLICLKREQHKNWLKNWEESKSHLRSFMEKKRYSMFFVFFAWA